MPNYKIIATIESIDFQGDELKLTLKGVSKYCFEKENDGAKEYWNILEPVAADAAAPMSLKQGEAIQIKNSANKMGIQYLFGYAFCERKRFKFELGGDGEDESTYTIIGMSNASD